MSDAEVVFHPDASEEYGEAYAWYAVRSERVADRFEKEIASALERIVEAPKRWPAYDEMHRKLLLRRFPYLVVYREYDGRTWVVAVAHAHRRPGYWKDRTAEPR